MEYLAQTAEGKIGANPEVKKAITINSPLAGDLKSLGVGLVRNCPRYRWGPFALPWPMDDRLANLSSRLAKRDTPINVQITTVVDRNNYVTHDRIPGVQMIALSTSSWTYGQFSPWGWGDVHDNIIDDPSGWAPSVAWR